MATEATSAAHAAVKSAAGGSRVAETRLGLSIFANVYESTHKVLVAESLHGVLRLLPSCIFHDATALYPSKSQSTSILLMFKTDRHPLPLTFHSVGAIHRRREPLQLAPD